MAVAGMLAAGVHICWPTHLDRAYIIWPSAGTLAAGVHICRLTCLDVHILNGVGWHACSRGAYMSADTLSMHILYWFSAGMLAAGCMICGSAVMARWPDQW